MTGSPVYWEDPAALADRITEQCQGRIVLAIPVALGKPVAFVNALYRKARADQSIRLKILTGLTLTRPEAESELERRFLKPVAERLFQGYEDLEYPSAVRAGTVPENIAISEFFLAAGKWLGVETAQQNFICANYTDAFRYIMDAGVNVVAQLVAAPSPDEKAAKETYSLSSNPDTTLQALAERQQGAANFQFVGQLSDELPFMGGDAEIPGREFDHLLGGPCRKTPLFNIPKRPVSLTQYAIGLRAARLVPDGGTLQIGIGAMGDAVAHALLLRHTRNDEYRALMNDLAFGPDEPPDCDDEPFREGLYGASEMFVDPFLALIEAGVVKREVGGALVHSSFFIGPKNFYRALNEMPRADRDKICMTSIDFVNNPFEFLDRKRRDRPNARFINSAMKATMLGAVVSDALESGQVVSGIGGQFDLVQQAFSLEGARSVIMLESTRERGGIPDSNIVWSYGHLTIPRQFRDIVLTEYGAADLRGRSDAEIISKMASVSDARFQEELLEAAKSAGKLPRGSVRPAWWKANTPQTIEAALRPAHDQGLLPEFPFGTDYTETEQELLRALTWLKLKAGSKSSEARLLWRGLTKRRATVNEERLLERMGLTSPTTFNEVVLRAILRAALSDR